MKVVFNKGIPGFEEYYNFVIKDLEENSKFKVMEADKDEISFVIVNPFEIYSEYEINLSDEIINELDIKKPEDVLILSIITLGKSLETSTMNLKAPIVINIKNNLGRQYILQNERYETKHPLIRRETNASNK